MIVPSWSAKARPYTACGCFSGTVTAPRYDPPMRAETVKLEDGGREERVLLDDGQVVERVVYDRDGALVWGDVYEVRLKPRDASAR